MQKDNVLDSDEKIQQVAFEIIHVMKVIAYKLSVCIAAIH